MGTRLFFKLQLKSLSIRPHTFWHLPISVEYIALFCYALQEIAGASNFV